MEGHLHAVLFDRVSAAEGLKIMALIRKTGCSIRCLRQGPSVDGTDFFGGLIDLAAQHEYNRGSAGFAVRRDLHVFRRLLELRCRGPIGKFKYTTTLSRSNDPSSTSGRSPATSSRPLNLRSTSAKRAW
jgi:hypothetical protein